MGPGRIALVLTFVTVAAWSAGYAAACALSPVIVSARPTAVSVATASPAPSATATPEVTPSPTPSPSPTVRVVTVPSATTAPPAPTAAPPGVGVLTITSTPTQGNRGTIFVVAFSGFPASPSGTDATMTISRPDGQRLTPTVVHAGPDGSGSAQFRSTLGDPSGPYFIEIQNGGFKGSVLVQVN